MRPVAESSSSWSHVVWASYTWVSLQAWSGMTDLAEVTRGALRQMAEVLKAAIDAVLKEARETQEQELIARPAAQAHQEAWLEMAAGRLNEVLSLVAMRAGGGSKDHPLVREFLPQLATGVVTAPIAERPRLLFEAATRLANLPAEFSEKAVLVERLRETATALQDSIARNDAARVAWSGERSEEVVAKNRLRLEMERTHGRLKALFPGRRGLVESFFRKAARVAETEADDVPTAPADDASSLPSTAAAPVPPVVPPVAPPASSNVSPQ